MHRPARLFLTLWVLAVCVTALGCSVSKEPASSLRESGPGKSGQAKPGARGKLPAYGMQAQRANRLREPDFELIRDGGVGFYRFSVLTSNSDDRDRPAVRIYDRLIAAAVSEGVELLPVFLRSRLKDRPSLGRVASPPESPAEHAEWRRRVRFFAERYGPGGNFWRERPDLPYRPIRIWEVWNEPNLPQFWDERGANPREYGRLLRETRAVLRAVDPGARILSAGIAWRYSGARYLAAVLDAAGPCSADAISVHPYAPTVETAIGHLADARAVAGSRGLHEVALWTTEIGWRVGGGGYYGVDTPAAQARALNGFLAATTRRRRELGLGPTFAFALRDRVDPTTGDVDSKWGLRLADDTPRPAWRVLTRWAKAAPRLPWPKPRACR